MQSVFRGLRGGRAAACEAARAPQRSTVRRTASTLTPPAAACDRKWREQPVPPHPLHPSLVGRRGLCGGGPAVKLPDTHLPPFFITDSTLREGEQFASAEFTTQDRIYLAKLLDGMGVDYIELVNPIASDNAFRECREIANLDLNAKIAVHIRCHEDDVMSAVKSGVDAVNVYMATSDALRSHSHNKSIAEVIEAAVKVVSFAMEHDVEVRFSCEDAFRSNLDDIIEVYKALTAVGIHRVGLADTVGVATPSEVQAVTMRVREAIGPDVGINFHTHNDTGCCVANALVAIESGATHIDTSILGIGERNGITPLGGLLARLYTLDPDYIRARFGLSTLAHLERYVAKCVKIDVPFNNYITGSAAFTHKAGVHSKAVMQNPSSYEVIKPEDFGVDRKIELAHRLTGWNALSARAKELKVSVSDAQIKIATGLIKNMADEETVSLEQLDHVLLTLSAIPQLDPDALTTTDESLSESAAVAKAAVQKFLVAAAEHAIATMPNRQVEVATRVIKIEGHLFDTAIVNRIMDVCVDSQIDFKVLSLDIPSNNASRSSTRIQFATRDEADLQGVFDSIVELATSTRFELAKAKVTWDAGPDASEAM